MYAANEINLSAAHVWDTDPFADFMGNVSADANTDLRLAILNHRDLVAKKRDKVMERTYFNRLRCSANHRQKGLLLHVVSHFLNTETREPLQIFLPGPASCGKTFVINLLLEIYNHSGGFSMSLSFFGFAHRKTTDTFYRKLGLVVFFSFAHRKTTDTFYGKFLDSVFLFGIFRMAVLRFQALQKLFFIHMSCCNKRNRITAVCKMSSK